MDTDNINDSSGSHLYTPIDPIHLSFAESEDGKNDAFCDNESIRTFEYRSFLSRRVDFVHRRHKIIHSPVNRNLQYNLSFVNIKDKRLRVAVSTNNVDSVEKFLESGADPNCSDKQLRRPLHLASCNGYKEVIRLLLRHGADPNLRDTNGNTPLHLAVCTSHMAVVVDLLNAGTDVEAKNFHGKNPLQLAQGKLRLFKMKPAGLSFDAENLKSDIKTIVEMMMKYMRIQKVDSKEVEALVLRLDNLNTREEVGNEISVLLKNFDNMDLSTKDPRE